MTSRLALLVVLTGCGRIGFDTGDGASGMFAIQDLRLVQAGDPAQTVLADPLDGSRLDVSPWLPTPGFAVQAIVADSPDAVYFNVNGAMWQENVRPYVSRGDDDLKAPFFDRTLRVGMNSVEVRTVLGPDTMLEDQKTVSFELDAAVAAGTVTGLSLVDPTSGATLQPLTNGDMISIASLPARIDVEATTTPALVGNVKFDVSGTIGRMSASNWPPYRVYETAGIAPQQGMYTIVATPHDRGDGAGAAGIASTVSFTFIP